MPFSTVRLPSSRPSFNDRRTSGTSFDSRKAPARPAPEVDEDTISSDFWRPNDVQFDAFLKRDEQLAQRNIQLALTGATRGMTMRDLKESCLHSIDTIERVLVSKIASGKVKEEAGRYLLVG